MHICVGICIDYFFSSITPRRRGRGEQTATNVDNAIVLDTTQVDMYMGEKCLEQFIKVVFSIESW